MKLRGNRKKFFRCRYHGQCCEVVDEIRQTVISRTEEKEEAKLEIKLGILEDKWDGFDWYWSLSDVVNEVEI